MLKLLRVVSALAALLLSGSGEARNCHHGVGHNCPRVCIASTADASGNSRTAYAIGVKPDVVTTNLAGLSFDGIDRDDQSSGLSAGVTGFGVATSDGSMQVKATIRLTVLGVIQVVAGKYQDGVGSADNYLLYVNSTNKLAFLVVNSGGTGIQADGTTVMTTGVNYVVQGDWNGSVASVSINSAQEGTTPALTALQAPDSTTAFTIGRESLGSTSGGAPYPFNGTIAAVSMTRGGVVQGQWALTSLSCP